MAAVRAEAVMVAAVTEVVARVAEETVAAVKAAGVMEEVEMVEAVRVVVAMAVEATVAVVREVVANRQRRTVCGRSLAR